MREGRRTWMAGVLLFPLLAPLGACDDSGGAGPANGVTSLSVYLTDAPGDVEEVWVEILGITLQGGPDGPVDLLGAPTELIPLTDLVGTTQLLASDVELDPNTYGQLRMVVGDAYLVSTDGTVYVKGAPVLPVELEGAPSGELQCPSCSQSGLKVTIPGDRVPLEEGSAALVLDFDVAQSFGHKAGNSGKWVMHPVIQGTLTDQPTSARAILGTVVLGVDQDQNPIAIPDCPAGEARSWQDFTPAATSDDLLNGEGDPIVRTGTVAEDGSFQIGFLAAGGYTLGYVEAMTLGDWVLSFNASVEPTQVTVGDADVEGVTYTIESATCEEASQGS